MSFLDFTGVPDVGGKTIPAGNYNVRIVDTNYRASSTGKPMLAITYEVVGGDYSRRKLFEFYMLDNNTGLGILKRIVFALGLKGINLPDYIGTKDKPANVVELHGQELEVKVTMRKDNNGEDRNTLSPAERTSSAVDDVPFGN